MRSCDLKSWAFKHDAPTLPQLEAKLHSSWGRVGVELGHKLGQSWAALKHPNGLRGLLALSQIIGERVQRELTYRWYQIPQHVKWSWKMGTWFLEHGANDADMPLGTCFLFTDHGAPEEDGTSTVAAVIFQVTSVMIPYVLRPSKDHGLTSQAKWTQTPSHHIATGTMKLQWASGALCLICTTCSSSSSASFHRP